MLFMQKNIFAQLTLPPQWKKTQI